MVIRLAALSVALTTAACVSPDPPAPTPPAAAPAPVVVPRDDVLDQVVVGPNSSCAVSERGHVACWGDGVALTGEQPEPSSTPVRVAVPPVSRLVAGERMWCAITVGQRQVWCWGANDDGALGRQTAGQHDMLPGPVIGFDGAVELVHRAGRTCARTGEGAVWCWGARSIPTRVRTDSLDGPLVLDDDGNPSDTEPDRADLQPFGTRTLADRGEHTCGVGHPSPDWCLRDDALDRNGSPTMLGRLHSVAAGAGHTCVLTERREAWCWGDNTSGQAGRPRPQLALDQPTQIPLEHPAEALLLKEDDICAQTTGGLLCPSRRCDVSQFEPAVPNPTPRPLAPRWCAHKGHIRACVDTPDGENDGSLASLSTGFFGICGIRSDGDMVCMPSARFDEQRFPGPFESVSVPHGVARLTDGTILWLNTFEQRLDPPPVPNLIELRTAREDRRVCGIDRDFGVWCWSTLGLTKPKRYEAPVALRQLAVADDHTCAIGDGGTLWCWGDNTRGQLGLGPPRCTDTPADLTPSILRVLEIGDATTP